MPTNAENAKALFEAALGQTEGPGEWFVVDQDRIDRFAEVTEDRQFIHVDPKMAAELSPWGTTIAHGFLSLSMLTHLMASVPQPHERAIGIVMGVNYGFEKVRFVNPVKVGSKIRAVGTLTSVELKDPNTLNVIRTVTVEIDGEAKPALVAEWVTRLVYS